MPDESHRFSTEQNPELATLDESQNVTFQFTTGQLDAELGAIDIMMQLLALIPYETRVRALRYVLDRVETDPNVWGEKRPERGLAQEASPDEIARVLAEADTDGRQWDAMNSAMRAPYFRCAHALLSKMVVETK
jgi:hypothetical protein